MVVVIVGDYDKVDARQPRVVELLGGPDKSPAQGMSHSLEFLI